jgi:hypothetical protein
VNNQERTAASMKIKLFHSDYQSDRLVASMVKILEANTLCSMATVGPQGESYIHTAYFCYSDELDIYFVSDQSTKHVLNLTQIPSMSVAVYDSGQPWEQPHRGLQLFGSCRKANAGDILKAMTVHIARFHAYGDYIKALSLKERRLLPYRFYIFRPLNIKLFDEPEFGEEVFILAQVQRRK